MQRDGWFDERGNELFEEALAAQGKEMRASIADGKIDEKELNQKLCSIVEKLRAVEPKLSDDVHKDFWSILQDMYVYSEMCLCYSNPERIATIRQYL